MTDAVFVTGATGFVGRRVVARLAAHGGTRVVCLVRPGSEDIGVGGDDVHRVPGDLLNSRAYEAELAQCERVVHLAAATGRSSRAEFRRVNVAGTAALLDACRRAGRLPIVHVSTIAVHFEDLNGYPYAATKAEGEKIVQGSGLDHTVIRPTLVLGRDGPAWGTLSALARLPVVPLPGRGTAPVQPVHVDDLSRLLVDVVRDFELTGGVHDVGGPEVTSVRKLLARIRWRLRGDKPRFFSLPLRPLIAAIAGLDRLLPVPPPVAPGQLSAFHQDGRVREGHLHGSIQDSLMGIDEMIDRCIGLEPPAGTRADA